MTNKQDIRDWFIMAAIAAVGASIMTYAFIFHSEAVFATACGTITGELGLFHWFTVRDDKTPDQR